MVEYYKISLSNKIFDEILSAIETTVNNTDDFDSVYELIHLYDYLEDEMMESKKRQDEDTRRYLEQQKLFTENKPDDIFQFHKIKAVLEDYDLYLDAESEFHIVCDLCKVLEK